MPSRIRQRRMLKTPDLKGSWIVDNATLWLDASQQNTLFTDAGVTPVETSGQSVYQWSDLSRNGWHAIQASSANRPTWNSPNNGRNGLGVVSLNGSSNFFSGTWQTFTDWTLFVIANSTNPSSGGGRLFTHSDNTSSDNGGTTKGYIPIAMSGSNFISTSVNDAGIMSVSFTANTYQCFVHRKVGTAGSNTIGSKTTSGTIGAVTRNMTKYLMGVAANSAGPYWAGKICEVIAFPRQLTSVEEVSVNRYLNTKWNTP